MNLDRLIFIRKLLSFATLAAFSLRLGTAQGSADRVIVPQDILSIDVFNEKELTKEQLRVSNTGEISFPLLKTVPVAGKTPSQVEKLMQNLLGKDYLVDPHVTVMIKTYRIRTVAVLGAVMKPGSIELPGEEKYTIVQAIARAEGPTNKANQRKIEFTHDGKTKTYNMKELKATTDPAKIIYVEPGDIITVPETLL